MKTKVQRFLDEVALVKRNKDGVKFSIGDSVENHRTLSVAQLVRYQRSTLLGALDLAFDIRNVKKYLIRNKLLQRVRRNNKRTDAYDVNEFVTAIRRYVLTNETRRKELNKIVSNY